MEETASNKSKFKTILKEIGWFLSSKIFIKNILAIIFTFLFIVFISSWWMRCYTLHGNSLTVPNFTNLSLAKAKDLASQHNLRVIVNDSIWTNKQKPGIILTQSPEPNAKVKEKRTIYLSISKYQAEEKILPSLVGNDNFNYYARRLKQMNIDLQVKEKEFNNKLEENTILYLIVDGKRKNFDDTKNGVKVAQGAVVQAVITTRGVGDVNIPNLTCKTYSEAEFIITGSRLAVGAVIKDGTVTALEESYVWKQDPPFILGNKIEVGQPIDVYLMRRRPEGCPR